MFTPVGKIGNTIQMREEATGQIWPVSEQTANDMLRSGSVKPGTLANNQLGGGGGGHPDAMRIQNAWQNPTPVTAPAPVPTPPQPSDPVAEANRRARIAAMQRGEAPPVTAGAAPADQREKVDPSGLTLVGQGSWGQPRKPTGPLTETVRTPGTKAHWAPQAQSRTGIDQGMQDNLVELELDNRRKALEANNAIYETTLQRANAESINAQRDRMMAEQEMRRKQEEDAERNTYAQSVTRRLQQEVEDVRTQKVSTWHQDAGLGGTILAAISMAMGAYAQGINGGPNTAADLINRAIDRDTQKKLGEKADRLDSAQQKLRNSMAEFGFSAEQRKQYMTALGQQQAAAYLKQQAADKELAFAHPVMLQNAAALEAQSNQTLTELAKTAQYNATERWVPASGGGLVTRLTPEGAAQTAEAKAQAELAKYNKDAGIGGSNLKPTGVTYGGEYVGEAPSDTVAKELNEKAVSALNVLDKLDRLDELQAKGNALSSEDRAALEAINEGLVNDVAQAASFRLGTENDVDRTKTITGSGAMDLLTRTNQARRDMLRQSITSGLHRSFNQYQLRVPGRKGRTVNAFSNSR